MSTIEKGEKSSSLAKDTSANMWVSALSRITFTQLLKSLSPYHQTSWYYSPKY